MRPGVGVPPGRDRALPALALMVHYDSAPGALALAYAEELPAWPASAKPLPPMPATDMAWDRAGTTAVVGDQSLSW